MKTGTIVRVKSSQVESMRTGHQAGVWTVQSVKGGLVTVIRNGEVARYGKFDLVVVG